MTAEFCLPAPDLTVSKICMIFYKYASAGYTARSSEYEKIARFFHGIRRKNYGTAKLFPAYFVMCKKQFGYYLQIFFKFNCNCCQYIQKSA